MATGLTVRNVTTPSVSRGISSYEEVIKQYITTRLQENYPEISSGAASALQDLVLNPLIEVLKPIVDAINSAAIIGDLSKASLMTEAELDSLGVSNYGVTRKVAVAASGTVYVSIPSEYMEDESQPIVITAVVMSNGDGLRYSSLETNIFKFTSNQVVTAEGNISSSLVSTFENVADGTFDFPIIITAAETGAAYNMVAAESTLSIISGPAVLLTEVIITTDITNGMAGETNTNYAERISATALASPRGTAKGYENEILDNFNSALNVYVAGKGNTLMTRDMATIRENGAYSYKGIGGKVDLYVNGNDVVTEKYYITYPDPASPVTTVKYFFRNQRLTTPVSVSVQSLHSLTADTGGSNWTVTDVSILAGGVTKVLKCLNITTNYSSVNDDSEKLIYTIKYQAYVDDTLSDTSVYTEAFFVDQAHGEIILPYSRLLSIGVVKDINTGTIIDNPLTSLFTEVISTAATSEYPKKMWDSGTVASASTWTSDSLQLPAGYYIPVSNIYLDNGCVIVIYGTGWSARATIASNNATGLLALSGKSVKGTPNYSDSCTYFIYAMKHFHENTVSDTHEIYGFDAKKVYSHSFDWTKTAYASHVIEMEVIYNSLPEAIQEYYDFDENRVISTEVTVLEALKKFITVTAYVVMKTGYVFSTFNSIMNAEIKKAMALYLANVGMGGTITSGDITAYVVANSYILDYVSSITILYANETDAIDVNCYPVINTVSLVDLRA